MPNPVYFCQQTHLILVVDLLEVRPGDDAVESVREGPQRPLPVPISRRLRTTAVKSINFPTSSSIPRLSIQTKDSLTPR